MQQQQQQQQQLVAPAAAAPLQPPMQPAAHAGTPPPQLPPPTSAVDLQRVLTVLQLLAAQGDANQIAGIVQNLQPAVLADVVLHLAPALPPRHALPPDHVPLEPWQQQLLAQLEPQTAPLGPGSLPPVAHVAPAQQPHAIPLPGQAPAGMYMPQPLQPPHVAPGQQAAVPGGVAAGRAPTPPLHQQQQRQPAQPAKEATPPPAAAAAAAAAAAQPKVAAPRPAPAAPAFVLAPRPLEPEQAAELRRAAVLRILGSRQVASPALQRALVSRLAASAGEGEALGDAVLAYLLQDFAGRGGFEICMAWLHSLFAAECAPLGAGGGGGGAGEGGLPAIDAASLAEFVNSGPRPVLHVLALCVGLAVMLKGLAGLLAAVPVTDCSVPPHRAARLTSWPRWSACACQGSGALAHARASCM